jgi:hypothetical protein
MYTQLLVILHLKICVEIILYDCLTTIDFYRKIYITPQSILTTNLKYANLLSLKPIH